jgi:hypothetical protein
MKRRRGWVLFAAVTAAAVSGRGAAVGQSYGVGSQVVTIGVSEFKGIAGAASRIGDHGYLENAVPGSYSYYLAPLPLPEGARLRNLCAYVDDSDPAEFGYVRTYLVAQKLGAGEFPVTAEIPGASAISSSNIGYGYYCSEEFSYTLRGTIDFEGDGGLDAAVHYVALYLPYPELNAISFGGVQITWERQVSAPPATPTFGDVPASHPFSQFVEALAASGITGGCGGGNFCPDNALTRGQMAVFLAKALGLHWAD